MATIPADTRFAARGTGTGRLRAVGKGGESTQIDEYVADFPPVRRQDRLFSGGDDGVGHRRREKSFQLRHAIELCDLFIDALLELDVPLLDRNRLALVLAILHRHGRVATGGADVFVNVVGGVRVDEPGCDLAVALAVASASRAVPLSSTPERTAPRFFST